MSDRPEMFEGTDRIWMDGEFVDFEDAQTHVLTHALHYGTGVFEGVRCYDTEQGPAVFRWEEHLDRLYKSAKPYDLDIEFSKDELTEATTELIETEGFESCYIRPIVYYGFDSLGVSPKDCPTKTTIAAWPWGAYLGEEALEEGVDVMVSSWRKHASSQIPTNIKTTGLYVNSMLAGEEARRNGYTEAIVLNKEATSPKGRARTSSWSGTEKSTRPDWPRASSKASPATPQSRSPRRWLHRPRGSDHLPR